MSPPAALSGAARPELARPELARRERKKRQLRDALVHAALQLFEAKGYEHTAVREITDAVDVSERTFFRYFASKEDLVLSFVGDQIGLFRQALAARPAAEEPLAAVRNAYRVMLTDPGPRRADGSLPSYLSISRLTESSPALLAATLRYVHDHDHEIIEVLAHREGVDPAADRRPRLMAALFGMLTALASQEWRESGGSGPEAMLGAFDAYAGQLRPALAGHWRAATPGQPS
jgi:AcrR family transcriptional regulator